MELDGAEQTCTTASASYARLCATNGPATKTTSRCILDAGSRNSLYLTLGDAFSHNPVADTDSADS